jgi:hypothetical protein
MKFNELTIPQIQQLLRDRTPVCIGVNAKFFAGDHWQCGAGWSGPTPPAGPGYQAVMEEIRRAFVSKNAIREVVGRHVGGVIGREPVWSLTVRRPLADGEEPTAEEQALIKEAEAILTEWWDQRGTHKLLQKATATLLRSDRAPLRLFVPHGLLVDGRVPPSDLRTALFRIYADHLAPEQATVLTDRSTMQDGSVYVYEEDRQTYAELSFLEGDQTVLRTLLGDMAQETRLDLGGQLLVHELQRDALITEQVRQHQMLLNLALTMLSRNVVQGGFLERIITNGMPPGQWTKDATTGKDVFQPAPMKVGAGTTNFINGLPIKDEKGNVTDYTDAGVVYRDPVSIETFRGTREVAYLGILEEAHQLHAAIAGDATASGESRRQAMADFIVDLLLTLPELNKAGRWLLETGLGLAAIFSGQAGRFASLRATFSCRIDPGPLSADELRLIIELVNAKLMSRETGMSRVGIEDVVAELARLLTEAETDRALLPPTKPTVSAEQGSTTSSQGDKAS